MFSVEPNIIMLTITVIFYLISGIFIIGSALALYSLLTYTRHRPEVYAVALTYTLVALALFLIALNQLHKIQI